MRGDDHVHAGRAAEGGQVSIHATAIVAEGAVIPASCTVGPYCTVGADVMLGEGCELVSHVVLDGHTTLGNGCKVFSFACVGIAPQDLKYAGEPTRVEIGDETVRSHVKRLKAKTGCAGIVDIVNQVSRLPPMVGALRQASFDLPLDDERA